MEKMYTSPMKIRLTAYLKNNIILVEEQNGFRKNSKTIDTFVAFLHFQKAFHWVNRDCLKKKCEW